MPDATCGSPTAVTHTAHERGSFLIVGDKVVLEGQLV